MSANGRHPPDPRADSPALALAGVTHAFGAVVVLQEVSLAVAPGEFLAVVGPSGCGKTTLLNLLSGSLTPTAGEVRRNGQARTVYQQDGLLPWLTVSENIELGLRGVAPAARAAQLADLLHLIRLADFAGHYPHQLSGGMKQRVELARALAGDSDILLMDEPFSALDYQTRLRMRRELLRLLAERPRTVIFVTHDIEEAVQLADRVLVLTERPARVACELRVTAPHPRSVTQPEFAAAVDRILRELGLEDGVEPARPVAAE
jgi:NitT/TauT family transport system ATP-binding protein